VRPGPHDQSTDPAHGDDPPGELVHVDIKKLGRIPPGGGWRVNGREAERGHWHRTKVGYAFVHTAVDGFTRLAYSEVLDDEQGATAAAFWRRAEAFFASQGIIIIYEWFTAISCFKGKIHTLRDH
jgi:Integrase core domain